MKVYTRKAFNYDGTNRELGEVFDLLGLRNDQKLLAHGYVRELAKKSELFNCTCGKDFARENEYHYHQRMEHPKNAPYALSS